MTEPGSHGEHDSCPADDVNVPMSHATHADCPVMGCAVPNPQREHWVTPVSLLNVPAALTGAAPSVDPHEPNEDVYEIVAGKLFRNADAPLSDTRRESAYVTELLETAGTERALVVPPPLRDEDDRQRE